MCSIEVKKKEMKSALACQNCERLAPIFFPRLSIEQNTINV